MVETLSKLVQPNLTETWFHADSNMVIKRSKAMPDLPLSSYSKLNVEEHRQKSPEDLCLQLQHKATITSFPFDPPFEFQLKNSYPQKDSGENEDEAEQVSPSLYSARRSLRTDSHYYDNAHEHQHSHQDEYQLQPQRFDPTPSFANKDHSLHECPLYTSEVSKLRLQVIELEFVNTTLENQVHKYREESRLLKQDIKGYKLDGRQFADLLMEKEQEIEILHRKIVQLLNQDSLPLPPRSTPRTMRGGSYKRYGHIADSSVKCCDFARNNGPQRISNGGVDQVGRAETDSKPQWWM